jgi:hypothetical protein
LNWEIKLTRQFIHLGADRKQITHGLLTRRRRVSYSIELNGKCLQELIGVETRVTKWISNE